MRIFQGLIKDIKRRYPHYRTDFYGIGNSKVLSASFYLFFAFIVRPYIRWLAYDPEKKEQKSIVEEYKPDVEMTRRQSLQVQEEVPFEKMSPKDQVIYLARNEPKRTTEAIRILMAPGSITPNYQSQRSVDTLEDSAENVPVKEQALSKG